MNIHADSQITDTETARLVSLAMRSPDHAMTYRLVEGRMVSRMEVLGRWHLETPEGPLHRIAVVRILDGEAVGFDEAYRDPADADAVWVHLVETLDEA